MTGLWNLITFTLVTFHGQVADLDRHKWFESLRSPKGGYCCAEADGIKVDDPSWGRDDQGYWVILDGKKTPVPPGTLVDKRNPNVNYAVVWSLHENGRPVIRCFLPGPET